MVTGLLKRARKPEKIAEYEKQLFVPPFPKEMSYLWQLYWRLRRRVPSGMSGREPVTHEAIVAFLAITKKTLTPWEVEVIEELDDLYRSAKADGGEDGTDG